MWEGIKEEFSKDEFRRDGWHFCVICRLVCLCLCGRAGKGDIHLVTPKDRVGVSSHLTRLGKPLIVVVNKDLMDNHQSELAEELAERKQLICAHPQTLGETIGAMDLGTLVPYVPGDAEPVVTLINKFLGFPVD